MPGAQWPPAPPPVVTNTQARRVSEVLRQTTCPKCTTSPVRLADYSLIEGANNGKTAVDQFWFKCGHCGLKWRKNIEVKP